MHEIGFDALLFTTIDEKAVSAISVRLKSETQYCYHFRPQRDSLIGPIMQGILSKTTMSVAFCEEGDGVEISAPLYLNTPFRSCFTKIFY